MAGYTRVDTINNIADGNVINAADLDGEFDGIQSAFNSSTGHNHDGTAGEGAPILALGPAQDVTISASVLGVKTTNTVDLGTSSLKFKDFYLAGTASIGGTLGVTGATTLSAALTYGGVTLSNAVTGTGNMVLSASPTLTGTITAAAANFSGAVVLNGNTTIGDADTDTITQAASYVTGTQLKSAKTDTNTLSLAAYDVDGTAYTNLITLTASNTPTLALTSTGVGTINNMSIGATTAAAGTFTSLSNSGNLTFTGTGNRITGDFSNATFANRVMFQTSTANSNTAVEAIPSGTGVNSTWTAYNNSDPTNASFISIGARSSTDGRVESSIRGTGTYLPMTFYTGGSERVRIDTSGNVGIGTTSPNNKLQVSGDGARIAAQCATNSAAATTEAELEAQVYNYWGGTGGPTYTGTAIQQYGAAATGTIAGISVANLGVLRFQNGAGGLIYTNGGTPLIFATTSIERMRIDSSGNVGIGTSSPQAKLHINSGAGSTQFRMGPNSTSSDRALISYNSTTNRFTIDMSGNDSVIVDGSGNVGIGTASPTALRTRNLEVSSSGTNDSAAVIVNKRGTGIATMRLATVGGADGFDINYNFPNTGMLGFYDLTAATTRMAIDSSGNLLVGTPSGLGTERLSVLRTVDSADYVAVFKTTAATATNNYGTQTVLNGDPNDATRTFLSCIGGAATTRAQIRSNGGLANYSANNVNLSDERTKTNIVNAGSYLAKICAIPVRTFKYKDQTDSLLNLGVIAQEVEAIAPELVDTTGFGETPDDGIPLKSIYQTDLQYALMKCIQEQQALITQLTARITALEGAKA